MEDKVKQGTNRHLSYHYRSISNIRLEWDSLKIMEIIGSWPKFSKM
jgi:hypothetical protein